MMNCCGELSRFVTPVLTACGGDFAASDGDILTMVGMLSMMGRLMWSHRYRLCPTPKGNFTELTEECFQQHPLDFVQNEQAIVFPNGTMLRLSAEQTTFVSEGTTPPGSMWSMIPMPPTLLGP
jgi:hypothetical protein